MPTPPQSRTILLRRAQALAGYNVGEVASMLKIPLPTNPQAAKGFTGQIAEVALGATAGANPIQDFPELCVELKTIPLGPKALPTESTHVCILLDQNLRGQTFLRSNVYNKLKCVLWLPIEGDTSIPLKERRFGTAFYWQFNANEEQQIKTDWEEIMEALVIGQSAAELSALGRYLQIRPAGTRQGERIYGFYLRRSFTSTIMSRYLSGEYDVMQQQICS